MGDLLVPTEPDGSAADPLRAATIQRASSRPPTSLAGTADAPPVRAQAGPVGVTALGLSDHQATPVAERMSGVEIHAQLLEGIFEGALLSRPPLGAPGARPPSDRGRARC